MSFDESLFSYFYKLRKRHKNELNEKRKIDAQAVELEQVKEELSFFASAVFQAPMEIRSTNGLAYQSSNKLFLPGYVASENQSEKNYLFYKLMILHLYGSYVYYREIPWPLSQTNSNTNDYASWEMIYLRKNEIQNYLNTLFPNYLSLFSYLTDNWSIAELEKTKPEEFQKIHSLEYGFCRFGIFGGTPKETTIVSGGNNESELREALPDAKTELINKKTHQINKLNLDENKENIGQDVFSHFEKLETLEEFNGVQREMDGEDELSMHGDALDELNLQEVIRSGKKAQSLYRTELDMGFELADQEGAESETKQLTYYYDEWDYQKRSYKKKWCAVHVENYQKKPVKTSDVENVSPKKPFVVLIKERKNEIENIKKKLLRVSSLYVKRKKLYDGRYVDIDNYIRNFTRLSQNLSSDGRNYLDLFKKNRDLCVLILVDNSLSADSWVQNKRILDLSLESLLLFGEAVETFNDPIMVAGFSSNTRSSCKFSIWKDFLGKWNNFVEIADEITPEGYTRIGPAIRHAREILLKRTEKKRVLLILTDGRPTDYDRYEGVYGLSDVRKSIEECERDGIIPFAIAVDPSAKQYLPKLFGSGNYSILQNISKLPDILTSLYIKISKK